MPEMDPREKWGRIILAVAVGALFLSVVGSMIAGRVLWVLVLFALGVGVGGALGMLSARRSG